MNRDIWLQIEGSLLERLVQRALRQGACFWELRRISKRELRVKTDRASAEILGALCERYGYGCRVLHRGGRTALIEAAHRRWTLALGALLCVALCALVLSRIWMIDVEFTGSCAALGDARALLTAVDDAGVKIGMPVRALDADFVQKQLMAEAGDYSFIGVRRQGIRLLVEAAPEVPAPELYDIAHIRDLVAARDGVIERITVHTGEACVRVGDTVRRGQTLIRGEEQRTKEETAPVGALGTVLARCWAEGRAEGRLTSALVRRTGRMETESRLRLMNFSVPLTRCAGFAQEERETQVLPVGGVFLPLEIVRMVHYETQIVREARDRAQLEAQLTALARADALAKISAEAIEIESMSEWIDAEEREDSLHIRAVYEMSTDIAVTRDALN